MKITLTSLIVKNPGEAFQFYTKVLGFVERLYEPAENMAIVASPEDPEGTGLLLEPNDNPISKTFQEALYKQSIPAIVFGVNDIQAEYERLRKSGVVFRKEPEQAGWGVGTVLEDTCGNLIQLVELGSLKNNGQGKLSHKEASVAFLQMVVEGKIHQAYTAFVDPEMRHHNVSCAGDAASLEKAMQENQVHFPHKELWVKQVLEDGDRVMVQSNIQMNAGEPGIATIHIFRFKDDRIVELWDLGQPVPAETPNQNGIF